MLYHPASFDDLTHHGEIEGCMRQDRPRKAHAIVHNSVDAMPNFLLDEIPVLLPDDILILMFYVEIPTYGFQLIHFNPIVMSMNP